MSVMLHYVMSLAVLLVLVTGCGNTESDISQTPDRPAVATPSDPLAGLPTPTDAMAVRGKKVWLDTCKPCHGTGLAGAPIIGHYEKWRRRIDQGINVLFEHALNGYEGKTGHFMPARGGNANLTDDEVKAAVTFMVQTTQTAYDRRKTR